MSEHNDRQLYCCNGLSAFLIDIDAAGRDPTAVLWSWTRNDSPEIPSQPDHKLWLVGIDECKPVLDGTAVLMTSSWGPGGICLVRKADRGCLFYACGANAHSADLIGSDLLAAALSDRCDRLRLYRLDRGVHDAQPAWEMPLVHGHGVVWDERRGVLWVLGGEVLLKLQVRPGASPEARVTASWPLAHPSGHDLLPFDDRHLAVTMDPAACLFDVDAERFVPLPVLGQLAHLKSLSRHPSGRIAYTQGEPIFTRTIHLASDTSDAQEAIVLPPMDLYKVRWNAPHCFA